MASDQATADAALLASQPTVVALDQTTTSNYGDSAASASSAGTSQAADDNLAGNLFNGLSAANGDAGLLLTPVHPFVGHPVQVDVCST